MLRQKRGAGQERQSADGRTDDDGDTDSFDTFDVPEQKRLFVPGDNLPGGWNIRGEISFEPRHKGMILHSASDRSVTGSFV